MVHVGEPRQAHPAEITQLTNITNEMVRGAPKLEDVLPELVRFAATTPSSATMSVSTLVFSKKIRS